MREIPGTDLSFSVLNVSFYSMCIRNAMVHHESLCKNFASISWMKQEMKRIQTQKNSFDLVELLCIYKSVLIVKDILNFRPMVILL